jgi:hypothetical protein
LINFIPFYEGGIKFGIVFVYKAYSIKQIGHIDSRENDDYVRLVGSTN